MSSCGDIATSSQWVSEAVTEEAVEVSSVEDDEAREDVLSPSLTQGPTDEEVASADTMSQTKTPIRKSVGQIPQRKRKRDDEDQLLQEVTRELGTVVSGLNTTGVRDCDDVFGEFVSNQLKLIKDPKVKARVTYEIHRLLLQAVLDNN